MFPCLPRKPVSYFDSGVDGMEILMPGARRFLKIPERRVSPEHEGPQIFPSLHPLDLVHRPPVRGPHVQDDRAVRDLCPEGHSPHSSPSSRTAGGVNFWETWR